MAPRRFMSEIDFTKTQLAIFFVVLLLSIDEYVSDIALQEEWEGPLNA
jgi:hypothetical protein